MDKRCGGQLFAEIEVGEEIVGRQAFEVFAQCRGQRRFLAGSLAVGKAQRAVPIADMDRPDMRDRIQPGGLLDIETEAGQRGLETFDRGLKGRVFAGNKGLPCGGIP